VLEETELERDSKRPVNGDRGTGGGAGAQPAATANSIATLPEEGLDLRAHLMAIERQLIEQALHRSRGTVAQAARLLNLRRTTLVEKMRKLGIAGASGELPSED
jgi:sigma-54 specific flagellar transcriptional regulator A